MIGKIKIRNINGGFYGSAHVGSHEMKHIYVTTGKIDGKKAYFLEERDFFNRRSMLSSETFFNATKLRAELKRMNVR